MRKLCKAAKAVPEGIGIALKCLKRKKCIIPLGNRTATEKDNKEIKKLGSIRR